MNAMLEIEQLLNDASVSHKRFGNGKVSYVSIKDGNNIEITIKFNEWIGRTFSLRKILFDSSFIFHDKSLKNKVYEVISNKLYIDNDFLALETFNIDKNLAIMDILIWHDNKEIYNQLIEKVKLIILKDYHSKTISELEKKYLYFALAWIAFENYNGDFWTYVRDQFPSLFYSRFTYISNLEDSIRKRISEQEKYQGRTHITSILVHAGVPIFYLKDFIDLVYDIYKINFDYDISDDDVDEILEQCVSGLVKLMGSQNDVEENLNLSQTKKTYLLIKSTRLAFKYYKETVTSLIKMVLELINYWYYDQKIEHGYPPVLIDALSKWAEQNREKKSERRPKERRKNPEFSFNSENKLFSLDFPAYTLKDINFPSPQKLKIILNINGEETQLDETMFTIEEKIGFFVLNIQKYTFVTFPRELTFEIVYENTTIHQNTVIRRNFLIFNKNGKELQNKREHNEIVYLVLPEGVRFDILESMNVVIHNSQYKIVAFIPERYKVYHCDDEQIYFSNLLKAGIYGEEIDNLEATENGSAIQMYQKLNFYVFETHLEPHNLILKINEQLYSFTQFIFEKTNNLNLYNYRIDLTKFNIKDNLNTISILDKDSKVQINDSKKFVLDSEFEIIFIDSDDPLAKDVMWNSSHFKEPVIFKEFDFSKHYFITNTFSLGGKTITYKINPPIRRFKWKDTEEWSILKDIELEDRKEICFSNDIEELKLFNQNRRDLKFRLNSLKNDVMTIFDLSPLQQFKVNNDFIFMDLIKNDIVMATVKVYINPYVIGHTSGKLQNNRVFIKLDIKNFHMNKLKLVLMDNKTIFKEIYLSIPEAYLTNIQPFRRYALKINKEQESIFDLAEDETIYETTLFFHDIERLQRKSFIVKKMLYFTTTANNEIEDREIENNPILLQFIERIQKNPNEFIDLDFQKEIGYRCILKKLNKDRRVSVFNHLHEVYVLINRNQKPPVISFEILDKDGAGIMLLDERRGFLVDSNTLDSDFTVSAMVINLDEGEFR